MPSTAAAERRRVAHVGQPLRAAPGRWGGAAGPTTSSPRSASRRATSPPSSPDAPVTRTRTAQASRWRRPSARARRGRSWSCAGCPPAASGRTSTAATGTPATSRTAAARSGSASPPRRGAPSRGTATTATTCAPRRPDADARGCIDLGQGLDPLLDSDRGHRSVGRPDDVRQPALDPEPAFGVEVADIAGAVPAVRVRGGRLGGPEPVVAVLRPGRADQDLAGAVRRRRWRPRRPATGKPDADAFAGPATAIPRRSMSATGRTSVMPYGVCASAWGSTASIRRSSGAGTGAPALISSRTPASASRCAGVSAPAVADDRAQRGRRGPDQRGAHGGRGVGELGGVQRGRLRHVDVGHRRGDPHRRAVQGERGEGRDQPVGRARCRTAPRARRGWPRPGGGGRRRPWPGRSRRR